MRTNADRPAVPRRLIVALVVGGMMPIIDTTIVTIGLHAIGEDLGADAATLSWMSTAYLLALAIAVPVVGWLQDRLGGRGAWILGLGVFSSASLLCALAPDAGVLIAFRVLQGLGAGILFPLMQTLPMQRVDRRAMARTMAVMSVPLALGPVLGPVVGGAILTALDWRWLFAVNVPVAAVGLGLALRWLGPSDPPRERVRLDVVGLILVAPGVAGVLLGLSNVAGVAAPTDVLVWGPVLVGVALVGLFVRRMRRRTHPLIDLGLLRVPTVRASTIAIFFLGANLYAATFLFPLALQSVYRTSVGGAALVLTAQGVGAVLSRVAAGRLVERFGARAVACGGFALVAVLTVPFALDEATLPLGVVVAVLFARGLGLGVVLVPVMAAGYLDIARERMPDASAFSRVAQQLGGAFGTAATVVVLQQVSARATPVEGFLGAFRGVVVICACAALTALLLPGREHVGNRAEPASGLESGDTGAS